MNAAAGAINGVDGRVPPRLDEPARRRWAWAAVVSLVAVAGAIVLFVFEPGRSHFFYPICLFHQTTGWLCPGCGSLRALHHLLHGRVPAALRSNAVLVFSLPLLAWWAIRFLSGANANRPALFRIHPGWLWSAGAVLIAFGILRNLPFPACALLSPPQ